MPDIATQDQFEVRLFGAEVVDHTVPVEVLVRTLHGLQQTALLLEASTEQTMVQTRFRPSEQLRRRCELRCGAVKAGSVTVELLGPADDAGRVGVGEAPVGRLLKFIDAVGRDDQKAVRQIVPDSRYRERALRETLSYLPRAGQRWGIELSHPGGGPIRLGVHTRRQIDEWFAMASAESMVVTGQLTTINFEKNTVSIRYPVTKKTLTFSYGVDAEDQLIQSRRDWVQVRGSFELDEAGNVASATEVLQIEPLDLSPLVVDRAEEGGVALSIDPPLSLNLSLDEESNQLLTAKDSSLSIDVFADTREKLGDELNQQLIFLWREYAMEEPAKLSPGARELRENLRKRMRAQ